MPKLIKLLETALHVADVKASADFYRRVFDLPTLLESDRLVALNVADQNVLLLFKEGVTADPYPTPGGVIPGHSGGGGQDHFAFGIAPGEFDAWRGRLRERGVAIESEVTWPGGARSLYFRDPDGHLGELITAGFWTGVSV